VTVPQRKEKPIDLPDDLAKALLAVPLDEMRLALAEYLMGSHSDPLSVHRAAPPRYLRDPLPEARILRVRVDLKGARPPIWRRLELASDMTLDELHHVLQGAMGWSDVHLHGFSAGGDYFSPKAQRFGGYDPFGDEVEEFERHPDAPHESEIRLDQILQEVGDRLWYEYDFTDSWTHVLRVGAVAPRPEGAVDAWCIGGRRDAPGEDTGGVDAYNEMVAQYGAEDFFDVDDVNEALS
jgi:hypothetical protein